MTEASQSTAVSTEVRPQKVPLVAGNSPRAIVPQDFEGAWRIGNAVCEAGMAPRGLETAQKCTIAILHGLEVGLPPMQALQSIAVINGRPSLWGDGAIGLIQSSGLLEDQDEHFEGTPGTDAYKAVCILKRRGKNRTYKAEFSVADAKQAGLWTKRGKNGEPTPWQSYWQRMLKMRARAFAMRDGFADVLKGLSIAEEQQDVELARQPDPEPEGDALADVPAPPPAGTAETAKAATQVIVDAVVEEIKKDDPISSGLPPKAEGDFPGDKPVTNGKGPVKDEDIPIQLDRRMSDNDRDLMMALGEAFDQCSNPEEIGAEWESIALPAKDAVSPYVWGRLEALMDEHVERVMRA